MSPYQLMLFVKKREDTRAAPEAPEARLARQIAAPEPVEVFFDIPFWQSMSKNNFQFEPTHGQKLMIPLLGYGTKTSQETTVRKIRSDTQIGEYLSPRDTLTVLLYFLFYSLVAFKFWVTQNFQKIKIKVIAAKDAHPTLNLSDDCRAFLFETDSEEKHQCLGAGYCNPEGCSYRNSCINVPMELSNSDQSQEAPHNAVI